MSFYEPTAPSPGLTKAGGLVAGRGGLRAGRNRTDSQPDYQSVGKGAAMGPGRPSLLRVTSYTVPQGQQWPWKGGGFPQNKLS